MAGLAAAMEPGSTHDASPRAADSVSASSAGWTEEGLASWYGDGGSTACGFHANYGVANKALPCGTRVTFRYGGKTVTAVVDDRGPYVGGREWDLNQNTAAAKWATQTHRAPLQARPVRAKRSSSTGKIQAAAAMSQRPPTAKSCATVPRSSRAGRYQVRGAGRLLGVAPRADLPGMMPRGKSTPTHRR